MAFDWRALVRTVAPTLGTALGGPLGGAAGAVLAQALGAPDASEKALGAALAGATPDQLLAVQKAEQEFELKLRELGIENLEALEKIAADDRASARDREKAVRDRTPMLLAFGVTAGFFGVLGFMLVRDIPQGSRDVLNVMLGALGTAWIAVITYYFGSSAGSEHKTELLSRGGK